MPIAFASLGLGVLVAGSIGNLNALAIVLATASLGAVMLRLMLTFQQNSAMLAESRREALTDALTGLGNRRHLLADLDAAYESPVRPRVLLAFDLNGFKAYNDGFGHAAGDQLLARLGRALSDAVGNDGRAYRLGGDEFCVLTEGAAFETLREAALSALSEEGQGFAISAAHGSAQIPAEVTDPSQALALADQRTYASKGGSRASAVAQLRDVLVGVLDERAPALSDHGAEVARWAHEVGRRLGLEGESLDELTRAAELHDIGKSAIPDAILSKPGPLSEEEWRFISYGPVTSASTAAATRKGWSPRRSRSARASSPSATRSTRWSATAPTAPQGRRRTRSPSCGGAPGRSLTAAWCTRSVTSSRHQRSRAALRAARTRGSAPSR